MGADGEAAVSQELIQILAAGFAGCSFAVIFHIRPKYMPMIFAGAALGWAVYLSSVRMKIGSAMGMVFAAMAITVYSEIFARIVKMPVSVIYTPTVIPLIPGSHLYYCMRGFVTDNHEVFMEFGQKLLEDALGIVLGSLIVLTVVSASAARKKHAGQAADFTTDRSN